MYSLAVGAMLPSIGLSWAFRVLGIVSCVVNLVCGNLLKDRNKAVGSRLKAFHLPLLKRPEFLLFLGWGIFSMLGYVALLFSVADFAISVGLSTHQGSIVSALLNLGQGLGRPFVGMFSDRLGRINISAFLTFLCGLFCLVIWIFARSMGVICFFAVLVGTVSGTYWATCAPVLAEIFDLRDLPSGLSINWLTLVPPTTVSEAIALVLRQRQSSSPYLRVQIFTGFMYIGAALCLWVVRGWKVGDLARVQEETAISEAATESNLNEKSAGSIGQDDSAEKAGDGPSEVRPLPASGTSAINPWSPVGFPRRMIAWKVV